MIGHLVRRAQLIGELAVDATVALLYATGAIRDPSRPNPIPARVPVPGCDCGRSDDLTDYHQHDVTCTVWNGAIRRMAGDVREEAELSCNQYSIDALQALKDAEWPHGKKYDDVQDIGIIRETAGAEPSAPCTAVLFIAGADYRCDQPCPHTGWAHGNRAAEAIWEGPTSSVGVGPQPPTEERPESPSPDVETQGTPAEAEQPHLAAGHWYITTALFRRRGTVVAGPFSTRLDATAARSAVEEVTPRHDYWIDQAPDSPRVVGKYDFQSPSDLETRVANLVNWWRSQAAESCDDGGSITVMSDQLERVLRGPNKNDATK